MKTKTTSVTKFSTANCWEYFKCGREPGGEAAKAHGVCPASTDESADGLNHGRNAGRICWAVAGTFCAGDVQGTHAEKELACGDCEFYELVRAEEGFLEFSILKPEQIGLPARKRTVKRVAAKKKTARQQSVGKKVVLKPKPSAKAKTALKQAPSAKLKKPASRKPAGKGAGGK